MPVTGIHATELVLLLLLLFVVAFGVLAQRLKVPYPIILVVAGLLLGFVPGLPRITLDPQLILFVVLPPLLYAAAWITSWQDFSRNLVSISSLAIGLVAFTVFGVAEAAPWLFSGFDWRVGAVLGAVVAPTDAIAATSIASRLGLPRGITAVLEGESLVNDATGLLALSFCTAMLVRGQTPTVSSGIWQLVSLTVIGITVGLTLGWIVEWFEERIDDAAIEIAVSIFVPYAAYLAAESAHGSGVLAVVAGGLYLSPKSSKFFSPSVRLQAMAVWKSITFILNGLVFVLIGLQLPYVLNGIKGLALHDLLLYAGLFSALLVLLRLLWTVPSAYVAYLIRKYLSRQAESVPDSRELFVIGWTGMRGVVALAAAISLPDTLGNATPFPQRNLIIFLTFSVILVTLVLQGLTLPHLIRMLRLAGAAGPRCEEQEARRLVLQAALEYLESRRSTNMSDSAGLYDDLALHYRDRLASVTGGDGDGPGSKRANYNRYLEVSRKLLDVERQTALRLRDEGRITDDILRQLEHELDLSETRLKETIDRHSEKPT
jgi:monovalent cation/hydrogen antiporter